MVKNHHVLLPVSVSGALPTGRLISRDLRLAVQPMAGDTRKPTWGPTAETGLAAPQGSFPRV